MTLEELVEFIRQQGGDSYRRHLEQDGLILEDPAVPWDYDATPSDSLTFATTGGNGVHFSLLEDIVVMTVPAGFDRENVVLGESLQEFLSLGLSKGFFELEQLSYDYEGTVSEYSTATGFGSRHLAELAERFSLAPWVDVAERLAELQTEYSHLLPSID